MSTKAELVTQNQDLQDQLTSQANNMGLTRETVVRLTTELSHEQTAHGRTTRRANVASGVAVVTTLVAAIEGGLLIGGGARSAAAPTETPGPTQKLDGGMPSQAPSFSPDGSGVIVSFPPASQAPVESQAPASQAPVESQALTLPETVFKLGENIPLPKSLNDVKVDASFPQGKWFYPVYNTFEADKAHDWRGIGTHFPVAWGNVDQDAAQLMTDQNLGELVMAGKKGGRVVLALYVPAIHKAEAEYANGVQDTHGGLQYSFHGFQPGTEISFIDPHTGGPLEWPDGTPIVYLPSDQGVLALQVPEDPNSDQVIIVTWNMEAQKSGEQAPNIKIQRGSNNHPELRGENPLSDGVNVPRISGN